jgi:hypothetical protein
MLNVSLLPRQLNGHHIFRGFWGSCRVRSLFLLFVAVATLAAQDSDSDSGTATKRITAASQFFDHDFVNFYVYGNGVWDSGLPTFNSNGQTVFNSSLGWARRRRCHRYSPLQRRRFQLELPWLVSRIRKQRHQRRPTTKSCPRLQKKIESPLDIRH